MAFDWARSARKVDSHFEKPSQKQREEILPKLLHTTKYSAFLKENPPHIVVNLMESFGSNMLVYDDEQNNDLLGNLRTHFNQDFVFYRFLSSANGTAVSFFNLFFESPSVALSNGKYQNTSLALNPFSIYANAGYEIIYITSGYASWRNLDKFISIQGANRIYDCVYIMEHYPQSKQDKSAYGVSDEYAYKLAFKILDNAKKPTFIAILTTSNRPPYHLPHNFTPNPISTQDIMPNIKDEARNKLTLSIQLYQYANDAFGYFMSNIKDSHLANNSIIVATGDHRVRDLAQNPITDKALHFAVPLYIYIPPNYQQQIHYDRMRIGSHKDIFPTLYALSLSDTTYMSVGERNILSLDDEPKYAFGYNESVYIDRDGIYPAHSQIGYKFLESSTHLGLLSTDIGFELEESQAQRYKQYNELLNISIAFRLFGINP